MAEKLEIIYGNPPFLDELRNVFRLPEGVIMTFGNKIYNPSSRPIDEPLYRHEEYHSKQQGEEPMKWWQRYLRDPAFRASQEIPSYQIQYQSAKQFIKDRNKLNKYLLSLALDLSGEMYGTIMTTNEAMDAIQREELYNFKT